MDHSTESAHTSKSTLNYATGSTTVDYQFPTASARDGKSCIDTVKAGEEEKEKKGNDCNNRWRKNENGVNDWIAKMRMVKPNEEEIDCQHAVFITKTIACIPTVSYPTAVYL
jgi:hypothetical protein